MKGEFSVYFDFLLYFKYTGCLENLNKIYFILSLLLTDSPIHSERVNDSVTDSKYVLNVLAILLFLEIILSFLINVILEPPCECLFEKYQPKNH